MFQVIKVSLFISICVVSQMFKGKENHLDLIQELRTVNALQREEQELQKADKELIKTLTDQRDKSRHKVKHTDTFMYIILQTPYNLITPSLSPLPRPLKRRRLRPEW